MPWPNFLDKLPTSSIYIVTDIIFSIKEMYHHDLSYYTIKDHGIDVARDMIGFFVYFLYNTVFSLTVLPSSHSEVLNMLLFGSVKKFCLITFKVILNSVIVNIKIF